jgi:hypothetical protein
MLIALAYFATAYVTPEKSFIGFDGGVNQEDVNINQALQQC